MVVTFNVIGLNMIPPRDNFRCYIVADYDNAGGDCYVGKGNGRVINLPHETKYGIGVENLSRARCFAEIEIDGKSIGNFFIPSGGIMKLKRGEKEDRCFVFISSESEVSAQLRVKNNIEKGEVRIRIKPEEIKFGFLRSKVVEFDGCGRPSNSSCAGFSYVGNGARPFYAAAAPNISSYGAAAVPEGGGCPYAAAGPSVGTACAASAGVERKGLGVVSDCVTDGVKSRDGLIVLREPTGQSLTYVSNFPTRVHHDFFFQLLLGDHNVNVLYNGSNDDDGKIFVSHASYKTL